MENKRSFRYLTIEEFNNGLQIFLNEEGIELVKELKEDGKSEFDIWYELFEDVRGNSEYIFHDDMGESGFGMTSAEGITDGYFYSENGDGYETEYPESAKVYWFPNYMITSSLDKMFEEGKVFFTKADEKYENGGSISDKKELKSIINNAKSQANRYGYDYVVYENKNGLAFSRKSEFERDSQENKKIAEVNSKGEVKYENKVNVTQRFIFGIEYKEKPSSKVFKKSSLTMVGNDNKEMNDAINENAELLKEQEGWHEVKITKKPIMDNGGSIDKDTIIRNKNKNDWKSKFDFYLKYNNGNIGKGSLMDMAYDDTKGVDSAIPQSLAGDVDNTAFFVYDYKDNFAGELVDLRDKLKFSNTKVAVTIVVDGVVLYKDKLPNELLNPTFHQALDYIFNHDEVEAFDIRPIKSRYENGGGIEKWKSVQSIKFKTKKEANKRLELHKSNNDIRNLRIEEVSKGDDLNHGYVIKYEIIDKENKYENGGGVGKKLNGYRVNIYKSKNYNSPQNVVSNEFDKIILVTDGIKGDSSTVMSNEPYIKLVKRSLFGKEILSAEPVNFGVDKNRKMFGGTFVWSSDSRFREDISEQPIPLHDRVEVYENGGIFVSPHVNDLHNYIIKSYGFLLPNEDESGYDKFTYSDFADELKSNYDIKNPRNKQVYDYLIHLGKIPMFSGKVSDMKKVEERMSTANVKFEKGGTVESLEKELRKLQRDLNSHRLLTYTEGDESEEQKALNKEREVKLARFNEVLGLLREKDSKFSKGGGINSGRDLLFKSNEPHEQSYKRKREFKKYGSNGNWFSDFFENGGGIENQNALMVMNDNKQIKHHTEELNKVVGLNTQVPAWVVSKVHRSASDLSDATHYLDGVNSEFEEGGKIGYGSIKKEKERLISELFEKCGVFFAFSNEQFEKNKTPLKEGEKYVSIGAGGYMPKGNVDIFREGMKEISQFGKNKVKENKLAETEILYELNNHECFYTGDYYSDVVDMFKGTYTAEQIRDVYNKNIKSQSFENGGGINTGRSWYLDRQKRNKSESWEKPMSQRKKRYDVGGGVGEISKSDIEKLYEEMNIDDWGYDYNEFEKFIILNKSIVYNMLKYNFSTKDIGDTLIDIQEKFESLPNKLISNYGYESNKELYKLVYDNKPLVFKLLGEEVSVSKIADILNDIETKGEGSKYSKGGGINSGRDLLFKSNEPHEQAYKRKREFKKYGSNGSWFNDFFKEGGNIEDSLLHHVLNHLSSGFVSLKLTDFGYNYTDSSNYKTIDEVKRRMVFILNENGDKQYSNNNLNDLIKEAAISLYGDSISDRLRAVKNYYDFKQTLETLLSIGIRNGNKTNQARIIIFKDITSELRGNKAKYWLNRFINEPDNFEWKNDWDSYVEDNIIEIGLGKDLRGIGSISYDDIQFEEGGKTESSITAYLGEVISIDLAEMALGRKINSWKDEVITIDGVSYQKVFLKPQYKQIK